MSPPITQPSSSSRDPSAFRGRALTTTTNQAPSRSHTPTATLPKLPPGNEATIPLERKPSSSGSYGHHRQTSIVHGNIQHSRNTSFNSQSTSPIAQQTIAESLDKHAMDGVMMGAKDVGPIPVLNPTTGQIGTGHSPSSSQTHANGDGVHMYSNSRRLERVHSSSGKLRNGHTPSHSRSHESRTVGEYALHHLFTSVSRCPPSPE